MSKRLHSIFVLRMFNDCMAMTLMYACMLAMSGRRWIVATILYSAALSVKMNVLLFYPAFSLIQLRETGLKKTINCHLIILATQILIAFPFLKNNPKAYVEIAFNLGRQFLWKWTVNWRFLGRDIFEYLQGTKLLILGQIIALLAVMHFRWLGNYGGIIGILRGFNEQKMPLSTREMMRWMMESNLVGIIFSRSLHYQFLSWYSLSIPYLLLVGTRESPLMAIAIYFGIEICWNVYPSTVWSSLLLLGLNLKLLLTK